MYIYIIEGFNGLIQLYNDTKMQLYKVVYCHRISNEGRDKNGQEARTRDDFCEDAEWPQWTKP